MLVANRCPKHPIIKGVVIRFITETPFGLMYEVARNRASEGVHFHGEELRFSEANLTVNLMPQEED